MTFEELETLVRETRWFEHLGEPLTDRGFVQIRTLAPWADVYTGDIELEKIADEMDWLPCSRNEVDPIYGILLEERSSQLGKEKECSKRSLDIYKKTLSSLRNFDGNEALKVGPHDFTESARGAALFAARRAACEVTLSNGGFWCNLMHLYRQGHWPCGILAGKDVVVF